MINGSTIKNVVLDIGQVLVDFRWKEYIKDLGFHDEVTSQLIQATVQNVKHWDKHDRGVLTDEEFIRESLGLVPGIEEELRLFFQGIDGIVEEYDYAVGLVKSLKKKGYRVYLLSNYGKATFETAKRKFKFIRYVDGMVISSHVHYVKPEPQIYQALLDKYGLLPEECVFIDDRMDNVTAADELGFHTILFRSIEQTKRDLEGYGIVVSS